MIDLTVPYSIEKIAGEDTICAKGLRLPLAKVLAWDGLEAYMRTLPQTEAPVEHIFSGGVYVRQMFIPKGTFIIGKRHRHETCNMLLQGELSIYPGGGKPVIRGKAPLVVTSEAMTRKIAYCHEDAVFVNIHPTAKTDLNEIESEFIITEHEFALIQGGEICHGAQ